MHISKLNSIHALAGVCLLYTVYRSHGSQWVPQKQCKELNAAFRTRLSASAEIAIECVCHFLYSGTPLNDHP